MRVVCLKSKHHGCSLAVEALSYRSFDPGKEYDVSDSDGVVLLSMLDEARKPYFKELKVKNELPPQEDKMLKAGGRVKNGA